MKKIGFLSKVMMVLALGAITIMPGIVSCKKSKSSGVTSSQLYSGQNFHGGQAPLPSTFLLLGSGLAGLGFLRWRKRNKP
jgi:hypothetical protein